MLAPRPDALLRVGGARRIVRGCFRAEEIGHELVHPRISKEKAGRLRKEGRRGHDAVLLLLEEVQEALANFRGGHGAEIWSDIRSA